MSNRFFPNYPSYIVTSRFGMRTLRGVKKMHNGIDLVATSDGETGQVDKLKAHTGGTVETVGYTNSVGNYVTIRVSPDTVMVYYHMRDRSHLKPGDAVNTGDIIGVMGMTGRSTGSHLHWGIKKSGSWIDPEPYLDADYPVAEPIAHGTVTTETLRVRANAGTNYAAVGTVNKGKQVDIFETKTVGGATWGRISNGWVCLTNYVELEKETFNVELTVLKRGMKGSEIEGLQALLIGYGADIERDGSFGAATEKAVKAYQKSVGMEQTGIVDEATRRSLMGL